MINLIKTNGIYIRKVDESVEFHNYKETKLKQIWNIIAGLGVDNYYEVIAFSKYNKTLNSNSRNFTAVNYIRKCEVFEIVQDQKKNSFRSKQLDVLWDENTIEIKDELTNLYGYKHQFLENVLNFTKVDEVKKFTSSFIFIPFH